MASCECNGVPISEMIVLNKRCLRSLFKLHDPFNIWAAEQPITYTIKRFKVVGFSCTKQKTQQKLGFLFGRTLDLGLNSRALRCKLTVAICRDGDILEA